MEMMSFLKSHRDMQLTEYLDTDEISPDVEAEKQCFPYRGK
jgi:hypothetical protein